jgi:hypothetical protein
VTTVVIDPGATVVRTEAGSLSVDFRAANPASSPPLVEVAS